jgi:flagella basal body P-ring formation protein FlgA
MTVMFDIEPENSPRATLRRMLLLLLAALVMAFGIAARADSVRLHDQVGVESSTVTLAQVAELKGASAIALGDVVLATLEEGRSECTITLDAIDAALDEAGVNWGLVSLRGFNTCKVTRLGPPPASVLDEGQAFAVNIETPIDLHTTLTLRDMLEQHIADRASSQLSDMKIQFSDRDAKKLDVPILGRMVEIEPISSNALGRVPIAIRLYDTNRVAETINVNAKVQHVILAVVADGPISRGEVFTRSRLKVQECYVDDSALTPITDPSTIIGQESASSLRAGQLISARLVKSPIMVKRGELVDVRCFVGGLVVRTVGRATENGSNDDLIRIHNDTGGEDYYAVITGRRQAVVSAGVAQADSTTAMAVSQQQGATP